LIDIDEGSDLDIYERCESSLNILEMNERRRRKTIQMRNDYGN